MLMEGEKSQAWLAKFGFERHTPLYPYYNSKKFKQKLNLQIQFF